jgi:UDP-N-acetylmuramate--alanine ligase
MNLETSWRHFHLVGMGGSGMVALARVLHQAGYRVSGSDLRESAALNSLRKLGVETYVGHHREQLGSADVVVVSAAIPSTNIEVIAADRIGVPCISRGEMLQRVVSDKKTAAVSGTHGKTTTSGMIATVLEVTGQDPTYLIGSDLSLRGPGGRLGNGPLAVVEADEAYGSFLFLEPDVAVVTNVEADHLDHYGDIEHLTSAFAEFVGSSKRVVLCADHPIAAALAIQGVTTTYGFAPTADLCATDVSTDADSATFTLTYQGQSHRVVLSTGGRHNVQNALGAIAACLGLGLALGDVIQAIASFKGVSRRFEYKGSARGADVIDDYAHHPTEIEATIAAARTGPWERIIAVFQPHLYSRTKDLATDFGDALAGADLVVVTDVYGAREDPIPGVSGKMVVDALCDVAPGMRVAYLPKLDDASSYVASEMRSGDLILTLGAGDITFLSERLIRLV